MNNIRQETRPWTRWWWMGSALTEAEITRCLIEFQQVGFGGVEVSPIYGPDSARERFVTFLSEEWQKLFAFTVSEAQRLGLGVDLIAGTGWPFGGPWVTDADAATRLRIEKNGGITPQDTVLARQETPEGVYLLLLSPTGQQVKRAAPGGAGNVLDHFNLPAVERYFAAMDEVVAPRCFFNDSWEVFGANGTRNIMEAFLRRRGYDLRAFLREFAGDGDPDTVQRVRSDYRETIDELTAAFLTQFRAWAHSRGAKIRNQAHGSPGNLLDLYAIADIPETEVFGPLRRSDMALPAGSELQNCVGDDEELLLCRFASSAAHITGKRLCSSESFTWLGEHGHVPLSHMKAEVDRLFCAGINHIFFHGTPYSPVDAGWPGWMFYASTHCAPTNPFWRDLPALNDYIAGCQRVLQEGVPDNDLLLYFPFFDLLASENGAHDLLQFMTVGRTSTYLRGSLRRFVETAHALEKGGWSFDLISDTQVRENLVPEAEGTLKAMGGARYQAILVAGCQRMPPETMNRLVELAEAGATVLFLDDLPQDVPGLWQRESRLLQLDIAKERLAALCTLGPELPVLLQNTGILPEEMTAVGLAFCRRRIGSETVYFIVNTGEKAIDARVPLRNSADSVFLYDPLTHQAGIAEGVDGKVRIALPAGGSLILRVGTEPSGVRPWKFRRPTSESPFVALDTGWRVTFIDGGPTLPPEQQLAELTDWTMWETEDLKAFSGTARYCITFDLAETTAETYLLNLGTVLHSARVSLNGESLGIRFTAPYQYEIPLARFRPTQNLLEVEVTNLMANRLRDRERRDGADWRPFLMVNIQYKPFDAADWPVSPSGLLGPVRLLPLEGTA